MNLARERALLALSFVLQAVVFAASAAAARQGQPPSLIVIGVAVSFVPYAGSLVFSRALTGVRSPCILAAAITSALGAIWLLAPPVLSDDLYRYIWEGRLWLEGFNPYDVPPDHPSLAPLRDEIWASINNKPLASVYPPLSQLLFATAAWLGGSAFTVKLLALGCLTLTAAWMARVTGDFRAALALGANPLLSSESALNGHFDVLVGAAMLAVAWELSRHRYVQAGVAVSVAVGFKVVGLILLPLLWRRPRVLVGTALGSALLLAPLVVSRMPGDSASGPTQFVTRWQGNESAFTLVDWLCRQALPNSTAGMAARVLVVTIFLAVVSVLLYRRVAPARAIRILVWSVLLLSPQVHPWYLGWLLPLELAVGGRAALIWSVAVLSAYAPLDGWVENGTWEMPLWLQVSEYVLVAAALFFDFRCNSKVFQ